MSILNVRRDLKQLKTACQHLIKRVEVAQEGARFRRQKERQLQLSKEIKQAMSYVELACRALEGDGEQSVEPSWLKGTMSRLSQALMRDDEPPAPLASTAANSAQPAQGANVPQDLGDGDFSGTTKALSVPDLLHLLRAQTQTGVLQVALVSEMVFIEFEDGDVVHAYSKNPPPNTRLGEILVNRGVITRERLESFLFCHTPSLGMLGQALNRGELVTEDHLKAALEEQIQRLFNRLFQQEEAEFWFLRGAPRHSDGRTRMNVISLLLESARLTDEAGSAS